MDPLEAALTGGEDYEIIIITPPDKVKDVIENVAFRTGTKLTAIGKVVRRSDLHFIKPNGSEYQFNGVGYEHFK